MNTFVSGNGPESTNTDENDELVEIWKSNEIGSDPDDEAAKATCNDGTLVGELDDPVGETSVATVGGSPSLNETRLDKESFRPPPDSGNGTTGCNPVELELGTLNNDESS